MKIRNNALLGGAIVVAVAAMGMLSTVWTPYDPLALSLGERFRAPSAVHLLGTDEFGRDIFSRILSGAGASLLVACLTVLMAITIGTLPRTGLGLELTSWKFTNSPLKLAPSLAHSARMAAMYSSERLPRFANGTPRRTSGRC